MFFLKSEFIFFICYKGGLMTEDIVYCTDCKAHYSNVIVIFGLYT